MGNFLSLQENSQGFSWQSHSKNNKRLLWLTPRNNGDFIKIPSLKDLRKCGISLILGYNCIIYFKGKIDENRPN